MKAELIKNTGEIVAIYRLNKEMMETGGCADGKISTVYSWGYDTKEPIDEHFFADAYIKWDGCSHFRFFGEDYTAKDDKTNKKVDAYYHICGLNPLTT